MTPEQITQLKAMSLQLAQGNLEQAKLTFEWLAEEFIEAEIYRRKARDESKAEALLLA